MIWFLLQYTLPQALPDSFDENIKQVIYDLGKYMRYVTILYAWKMFDVLWVALLIDILCFTASNFNIYYMPRSGWSFMLFSCIFCRWLSSKENHEEDIMYWKKEIPRIMCEMQKYLPPAFFNAQEQYLIHQFEEIELCGPVNSRSMWLVERHLNTLKDFFRKRAHPKGSMV